MASKYMLTPRSLGRSAPKRDELDKVGLCLLVAGGFVFLLAALWATIGILIWLAKFAAAQWASVGIGWAL